MLVGYGAIGVVVISFDAGTMRSAGRKPFRKRKACTLVALEAA